MTGYRESLDRLTARISMMTGAFQIATKSIEGIAKAEKRRQKAIDRVAWKAESKQRFQKGMHFK